MADKDTRKAALYRCGLFNCSHTRCKWQCCNYCVSNADCRMRCNNDSERCGKLVIERELFLALRKLEE